VISPAISEGISQNKEQMIDALYPIMGGMISKYVTQAIKEMMETINRKIESGLSLERYKRKLKAKLTGVSESELLLEESADAQLLALFIIHKESGLLIAEAHQEESKIDDVHMVASMASAIKDFINDWIAGHQETSKEVQILSYGDATLYIEGAGSVYMIAFLDSEPDYEQRADITAFFATLLEEYTPLFQHFEGDLSDKRINALEAQMQHYLQQHSPHQANPKKSQKSHTKSPIGKYLILAMGVGVVGYIGYYMLESYTLAQIEKRILAQTGERVTIDKEANHLIVQGTLKDPLHYQKVVSVAKQNSFGADVETELTITVKGAKRFQQNFMQHLLELQRENLSKQHRFYVENYQKVQQKITQLEQKLQQTQEQIEMFHQKKKQLLHLVDIHNEIKQRLTKTLKNSPYYQPKTASLNFAALHLFAAEAVTPTAQKEATLLKEIRRYLKTLKPYLPYLASIDITSYSDSTGDATHNLALTQARADYIKALLLKQRDLAPFFSLLHAKGAGESSLVTSNGQEDHEASRRVTLSYRLNEEKIRTSLKQIIPSEGSTP